MVWPVVDIRQPFTSIGPDGYLTQKILETILTNVCAQPCDPGIVWPIWWTTIRPKNYWTTIKSGADLQKKHYHRIVSKIWPSLWSKQKEICKLSSSRKNRQVKIQKKLTKMTSNKLNGRADQEKDRQLEKRKVQRNALRAFSFESPRGFKDTESLDVKFAS